ncbi:sulfatase-like hydrolase/transferase [Niabella ginsengisoli]|uniref:Sulfatase-like hydrolase/transferase n=1 Tax=Niabella ginsengisoli TaxID=522298 RepID=A0ABS9SIT8_9BACT|nr:sulfatase-like hydrolase/transferase [Niabella ginsengisoli]MCH5598265.1 sulfatase-like hydrolase/transferase [Niabella ginsengisoli]
MKRLLMMLAMGFGTCIIANGQNNKLSQRPNIILFLVDDMGWMDTSQPFGDSAMELNRKYHTPNMERMAKDGLLFKQAYVNSVCTPTRTTLISGMSSVRTHITNWTSITPNQATDYKDDELSAPAWNISGLSTGNDLNTYHCEKPLPQLLKDAGYFTIHVGKAHWGSLGTKGSDPMNLGFVVNIAGSSLGHPQSYYGQQNFGNMPGKATFNAVPDLQAFYGKDTFLTEALTQKAISAIDFPIKEKKPFFLYLGHYAVHVPLQPDKRYVSKYVAAGLDSTEAAYASLLEGMDKSLGDIMDYLKKKEIEKNTIIIFMSDNGGLSNTGRGGIRNTHNLPLRAGKGSPYEGGVRIPMLVKWPSVIKPGSKTNSYVSAEDFFPTVLKMAGIKFTGTVDGKSYLPVLKNPSIVKNDRPLLFHYPNRWTTKEDEGYAWSSGMRFGKWKLIYLMKQKNLNCTILIMI